MIGQQYLGNTIAPPMWMGDFSSRDHILPVPAKLDPAQFSDRAGISVAVTASASQNATSVTVTALTVPPTAAASLVSTGTVVIPKGSLINFGGAKVAVLSADAKVGDTTLSVQALPTALAGTETATFSRYGTIFLPSGILLGRTYAERDAGTAFGPAATTDDEIFLMAFDVPNALNNNDCELYRHHSLVKENYLPDWTTLSTAASEVQTVTITGTPTGGTFTLTYNGATTTALAYNASTSAVQTALNALATIGASGVTVTGSAGTSYTVTFNATISATNPSLLAADPGGLTGGTPAMAVTRTTAGGTALLNAIRTRYRCVKGQD
jgi:hypothetical protein